MFVSAVNVVRQELGQQSKTIGADLPASALHSFQEIFLQTCSRLQQEYS